MLAGYSLPIVNFEHVNAGWVWSENVFVMFSPRMKGLILDDVDVAFAWIIKDFLNFYHEYLLSLELQV